MPYDPRSSRPTPKTVPDEESAPVDALLGPSPDGADIDDDVAAPVASLSGSSSGVRSDATALPVPVRKGGRAPSPILQLAPLLVALAVALLWLIRRSRR
jgi:hypothetical protein